MEVIRPIFQQNENLSYELLRMPKVLKLPTMNALLVLLAVSLVGIAEGLAWEPAQATPSQNVTYDPAPKPTTGPLLGELELAKRDTVGHDTCGFISGDPDS